MEYSISEDSDNSELDNNNNYQVVIFFSKA